MIRVLHVLGGLNLGGAESMVMNLYRAIDREHIQFDFIIHTQEKQAYEDEITLLGGKIYRFPPFTGTNIFDVRKRWNNFFLEHPEYKILHSHVRSYASIYLPIANKNGVTTIVHSHSTSNGSGISSLVKNVMQFPLRYQADYCFGCSKEAGEWLFGKKVVTSKKYKMIKNAIDTEKYKYNESIRNKYRNELNINENTKVYIHIGRLHEAKNHSFLLELFRELHNLNPDSILLIVGDGNLHLKIQQKIVELGLNDSVKMLGARNDVSNILQAADCFLFPSLWEGLPVTVVEAQASGLRCFVSDKVTKEVNVSSLVINITIDKGVSPWVEEIKKYKFERYDVIDEIKKAGFDIDSSATWLSNFYRGLIR